MHIVHHHGVHAPAEVQQVLDDVGHARLAVVVAGVGLVVREQNAVRRRVIPPRHSQHHHLT